MPPSEFKEKPSEMTGFKKRFLRWIPFGVMAVISLWVAAGLPHARKPFSVDLSVSPEALALSVAKLKHHESTAMFFALAVLAVGVRKPWVPFWLSLALGAAWELAESTARRHTARLADLAPDLLAAVGCVGMLFLLRSAFDRREASRANQPVGARPATASPSQKA